MNNEDLERYIQELEQYILEYDLLSEDEKSRIRQYIRGEKQKRFKKQEYKRQTIAIAEKIYNEVLDFTKNSKSINTHALTSKFKIGISTAEYLIDKLYNEGLIELKYGIYWVKSNNDK